MSNIIQPSNSAYGVKITSNSLGGMLFNSLLQPKENGTSSWWTNTVNPKKADQKFQSYQANLDRIYNAEQAQLQREFNAEQSQLQREFEERLSNSAYQRAVEDMQKAGLNPYLAYSQGGAVTPNASSASGLTASHNGSYSSSNGNPFMQFASSVASSAISSAVSGAVKLIATALMK